MSIKLRDFISAVRACKSGSEEAALVAKECAAIRTSFKEEQNSYRHRNVAKLIFIDMLGYPISFGQLECLKLIASSKFLEKIIGYISMPILLDQRSDLLMLATNTMKGDLGQGTQYVGSAALVALANSGTPEMIEILNVEIGTVLSGMNPILRRKAVIAFSKMIGANPSAADRIAPKLSSLVTDKTHGSVACAAELMRTMVKVNGSLTVVTMNTVRSCMQPLLRLEKDLLQGSSAMACGNRVQHSGSGIKLGMNHGMNNELDFGGVNDPMLQVILMSLFKQAIQFRVMDADSISQCKELCDIGLTFCANYKTAGLSVVTELIRLAKAIMEAQPQDLSFVKRSMEHINQWIAYLLTTKDSTSKFVGVQLIQELLENDQDDINADSCSLLVKNEMLKHRAVLLSDSLKQPDSLLQRKVVKVLSKMIQKNSGEEAITSFFNLLLQLSDPLPVLRLENEPSGRDVSFTGSAHQVVSVNAAPALQVREKNMLIDTLIQVIQKAINMYAPTRAWQIDSLLRLCSLTGNLIDDDGTKGGIALTLLSTTEFYPDLFERLAQMLETNSYQIALAEIGVFVLGDICGQNVGNTTVDVSRRSVSLRQVASRSQTANNRDRDQHKGKRSMRERQGQGSESLRGLGRRGDDDSPENLMDQDHSPEDHLAQLVLNHEETGQQFARKLDGLNYDDDSEQIKDKTHTHTHTPTSNIEKESDTSDLKYCNNDPATALRIVEQIIDLYGLTEQEVSRETAYLAHNRLSRGVLRGIGGDCIMKFPSPEKNHLASDYSYRQGRLPQPTLKAFKSSRLVSVVCSSLAKIGVRDISLIGHVKKLLLELLKSTTDASLRCSIPENLFVLDHPEIHHVLKSRCHHISSNTVTLPLGTFTNTHTHTHTHTHTLPSNESAQRDSDPNENKQSLSSTSTYANANEESSTPPHHKALDLNQSIQSDHFNAPGSHDHFKEKTHDHFPPDHPRPTSSHRSPNFLEDLL